MRFEKFFNTNKKINVSCKTEKDANILIGMFENSSLKWNTGEYYSLEGTQWNVYKEGTFYTNYGMFGSEPYIEGEKLSFGDFLGLYYDDVLSNLRDMKYRGIINNKQFLNLFDISTEYAYKHCTFGESYNLDFHRFFKSYKVGVSCKAKDDFLTFEMLMDLARQRMSSGNNYTSDVNKWNYYNKESIFGCDRKCGALRHYGGYVIHSFDKFLKLYNRDVLNILHKGGRSHLFNNNHKAVDFITRIIDAMEEI